MRSFLAHALRWSARWQIAVSNCLLPPTETPYDGWDLSRYRAGAEIEMPWADDEPQRITTPLSVTYTGGPEGPAARKVRLQGMDDSVWDLSGPPAREEC